MWQFAQQIVASNDDLSRLNEDLAVDRHMNFCVLGQPKIGATITLTQTLAKAHERFRCETKAVPAKLKYDIIALVCLHPKRIGAIVAKLVIGVGVQVHDFALDRTARRISAKAIDLDDDSVRFSLQDALIDKVNFHNAAIDRAYNTQGYGGDSPSRIAKDQHEHGEQGDGAGKPDDAKILIRNPANQDRSEQEWNALMGNKGVPSTLQRTGIPAVKRHATIPCFARGVNTYAP